MSPFLLIANPFSGKKRGRDLSDFVVARLEASGISVQVVVTEYAEQAAELVKAISPADYMGLGVIGGDGTVHNLINGCMQQSERSRLPLAFFAGGTGNAIHHQLGIQNIAKAIECILQRRTQPLDLLRVQTGERSTCCINIAGWAGGMNIARRAETMRWLGPARYSLAAIIEIFFGRRQPFRVELPDQAYEDRYFLIIACNTIQAGGALKIAPLASTRDGLMDLIFVRDAGRFQLLKMFQLVKTGSHLELPFVEYHQVSRMIVRSAQPVYVNLDGDLTTEACQEFHLEVLPAALTVFA